MNKKILIFLNIAIFVVLIINLGFVSYSNYNLQKEIRQKVLVETNDNSNQNLPGKMISGISTVQTDQNQNSGVLIYSEEKDLPESIFGTIKSVSSDKFLLKQLAEIDVEYEIKKESVSKIILNKKNPNYEEEKVKAIQLEQAKKFQDSSQTYKLDPSDLNNQSADKTTDPIIEESGSWSDLKAGQTVNLTIGQNGRMLKVYSENVTKL